MSPRTGQKIAKIIIWAAAVIVLATLAFVII
jgi:hypothetical protein